MTCLEFDGGKAAEGVLAASAVVGAFDADDDREAGLSGDIAARLDAAITDAVAAERTESSSARRADMSSTVVDLTANRSDGEVGSNA